jgi:UDP-N-acetylglucosamine transferase subunit ALG13
MADSVAGAPTARRAQLLGIRFMIFVTVGSMLPFDRLIIGMDNWARENATQDVLAQIGGGRYTPNRMRWKRMLQPSEFREALGEASIMVAHAGMGSYFVASEMRKPMVLLPRLAAKREHTTDHQLHTVKWLGDKPGVYVAMSEDELGPAISKALGQGSAVTEDLPHFAPEPFLTKIREFLVE